MDIEEHDDGTSPRSRRALLEDGAEDLCEITLTLVAGKLRPTELDVDDDLAESARRWFDVAGDPRPVLSVEYRLLIMLLLAEERRGDDLVTLVSKQMTPEMDS